MSYDNGVRESISRTAAGYKNGLMTRFHQHQLAASYQLAAFQHALAIARCCLCRVLDAQTHRSAWINALVAAACRQPCMAVVRSAGTRCLAAHQPNMHASARA